jgi:hypothetical protein
MRGDPSVHKEFRKAVEHVIRSQPSFDLEGQTFPRIFVHNGAELHRSPIFGPCRHEVVRPHRIRMLRSQSDTGAFGEPEPPTRRLFLGHHQAFAPPHPFHPLVLDPPALVPQQTGDLTIPLPTILACELDNRLGQRRLIIGWLPLIPLRGAGLPQYPAHPAFCEAQHRTAVLHGLPSARWA